MAKRHLSRLFTLVMAVMMFCAAFMPQSVFAATDDTIVRIKLSIGTVTSKQIVIDGNYYIDGAKNIQLYRDKYTLSVNGDKVTLMDSAGNELITSSSITFVQCKPTKTNNFITIGDRNYLGNIVFKVNSSGKLYAINHVFIEEYLIGVLAGEISDNYADAAIQAQAILARTFAVTNIAPSSEYDMVDTSSDQVYKGYNSSWTKFKAAVEATSRQIVCCDGEIVGVHYTASNGGYIEIYQHNWYAKKELEPYDVVRVDPYDYASSKATRETLKIYKDLTKNSISTALTKYLKDLIIKKKDSDSLKRDDIELVSVDSVKASKTREGHETMPTNKCKNHSSDKFVNGSDVLDYCPNYSRYTFKVTAKVNGTKESISVDVEVDKLKGNGTYPAFSSSSLKLFRLAEKDSYYELTLCRSGHGNGFSQSGAYQMGKEGKTCKQIVDFYYPHCEIKADENIRTPEYSEVEVGENPIVPELQCVGTVIDGGVNVRSGAGTSYSKLGTLSEGDIAEIYDTKYKDGWYKINYDGTVGFVSSAYVKIDDFGMTVTAQGTMTGSAVNVRRGPGSGHDKIAVTGSKGESIDIIKANAASGWHRIVYKGRYGYISSSYVSGITGMVSVSGVKLDASEKALKVGESFTLKATVEPSDANNKNVTWTSSDDKVATVADGKVTAVAAGKAVITVKTEDGGFTASCNITVEPVKVTGVSLDASEKTLKVGESFTLKATVTPSGAENKNVTWKSSDSNVAAVADGKVTAVSAGTAVITVKTEDGGFTAECKVTVKPVAVTGIKLSETEKSLESGENFTLTATVLPENAANKNVIWSTSDEKVASVKDGRVTANAAGTARITAKTEDGGFTAYCDVTVTKTVVDDGSVIAVGLTTNAINVREQMSTESNILGVVQRGALVEITGNFEGWRRINYNGKVGYIIDGYVNIDENGLNVECSAKINASKVKLRRGPDTSYDELATAVRGESLSVIHKNYNADWSQVFYKGQYGFMWTEYLEMTAAEVIKVTGISISAGEKTLKVGESATVTATVKPSNATNKNVIWTSSDSGVAKVSGGKITGVKEGTAVITATSEDGNFKANCKVTVVAEEESNVVTAIGTAKADIPVLKEKSAGAETLGTLKKNSLVEIFSVSGDWAAINYNGKKAYVEAKNVAVIENGLKAIAEGKVTGSDVNVRRGPGTAFDKVGLAAKNARVEILDMKSYSGWYRICLNGTYGYMSSQYIEVIEDPGEPSLTPDIVAIGFTTEKTNVRTGPGTKYDKAGSMIGGSVVEIMDKNAGSNWYKIKYNGKVCYMCSDYIRLYEGGTTVTAKGIVTGSDVKLRRGPGTEYDQIGLASKNSEIYILKENASSGWHLVLYNGVYGYMSAKYIKIG